MTIININIIKNHYIHNMKAKEVLNLLKVTRQTLTRYVKEGKIGINIMPNGQYNYNKSDVETFLNKGIERKIVLYGRVSTSKQKKDLENQIHLLKQYCYSNGIKINSIYKEVASGISFEKRKEFFQMLEEIIERKVEKVIITYKDRLSRVGFDLFKYLFNKYSTEIIVVSEIGSEKLDSQEIFEEIVSLLHCYSMKLYSKRKRKIVEDLCKE